MTSCRLFQPPTSVFRGRARALRRRQSWWHRGVMDARQGDGSSWGTTTDTHHRRRTAAARTALRQRPPHDYIVAISSSPSTTGWTSLRQWWHRRVTVMRVCRSSQTSSRCNALLGGSPHGTAGSTVIRWWRLFYSDTLVYVSVCYSRLTSKSWLTNTSSRDHTAHLSLSCQLETFFQDRLCLLLSLTTHTIWTAS